MSNIILVDSSYTSFYRFFATLRWFSLSNMELYKKYKDDPTFDWSLEPIFFEKYKKMYLDSIKTLVGSIVYQDSTIVFCLDSPQESLWRKELSECYKGNRVDLSLKNNFIPTFRYTYNELIPSFVATYNFIHMIKIPRMEADDIIALSVKYIRYRRPNLNVYVVSGDNDFLQLGYDKLYFADYKKISTRPQIFQLSKEEAKEALKQKIINGDCSDNIPSIFPKDEKLNNKMKKLIKENNSELKKYLAGNTKAMKQYLHNKKMISFRYIPKNLRKPIYSAIKKLV